MTDYTGAQKEPSKEPSDKPEKKLDKVVTGEVVVKKKGIGRKFKDLFVAADIQGAIGTVVMDVLIPAVRNTIVDATTMGIERVMFGESSVRSRRPGRPGNGPRYTYQTPVSRGYSTPRHAPARERGPRRSSRMAAAEVVLHSESDAVAVLDMMNTILEQYEVVSVADLNELIGEESTHTDHKYGWVFLGDAEIRRIREGYLIDLPPVEPIP